MTGGRTLGRIGKRQAAIVGLAGLASAAMVALAPASHAATCTVTGYSRDGINLTAALIDPVGPVSGTVDATGCNIGVFYDQGLGAVSAEVYGANYFGVAVVPQAGQSASVNVSGAWIHDIGESPLNGSQHGVGVYFNGVNGTVTGKVFNSVFTNYQKGGIVANGPGASANIQGNTVTGKGAVNWIAQNGIQIGYGATAIVSKNTVSDNGYTGDSAYGTGILVYGDNAPGHSYTSNVQVSSNTLTDNQYGVDAENWNAADWSASTVATNNKVSKNTIAISAAAASSYTSTAFSPVIAGVYDVGTHDAITGNTISGYGQFAIVSGTDTRSHGNTIVA